jgi:Fe2+ transport system protein FeoA
MTDHDARVPLSFVAEGQAVKLAELGVGIDVRQREQLTAYGLAPGQTLTVLQQRPMTVILADEVELALEASVARHVWVEPQPKA